MDRDTRDSRTVSRHTAGRQRARVVRLGIVEDEGTSVSNTVALATELEVTCTDSAVNRRLSNFLRAAHYDVTRLLQGAEAIAADAETGLHLDRDSLGLAFICSLLLDLQAWGAHIEVHRSRVHVRVAAPGTAYASQRTVIKNALVRLRGSTEAYTPPVSRSEATRFLAEGSVRLERAETGSRAGHAFTTGITTWSMPYRSREGRSARFALLGELDDDSVPIGLLEIADDAPHNPIRDEAAGFQIGFNELSEKEREKLAHRLAAFRAALLPDGLTPPPSAPVTCVLKNLQRIRQQGKGRTGTTKEIHFRKRLTYMARLASAEAALLGLEGTEQEWLADGLRAIRDLTLPRIHMEISICGALPPFGPLLGGKLVAAMAAHPTIRTLVDRPFGEIVSGLFDTAALMNLMPNSGLLMVTTKGLYPGHSAQYTGVKVPGREGTLVPMRKWGDTTGQTTSHISDRTMRIAAALTATDKTREVSRVFGSGGAKRQRTLEQAALLLGLPGRLLHAQVSRPVYGIHLCSNIREVVLFGEPPQFNVRDYKNMTPASSYEAEALAAWRARWLPVVMRRSSAKGEASERPAS